MLIRKKNIKILTPASENCRILDIRKVETVGLGAQNIDPDNKIPVTVSREEFDYEFYFQYDLRKLVEKATAGNVYRVEFEIQKSETIKTMGFFRNAGSDQKRVMGALHGAQRDNKRRLAQDKKEKIIAKGKINLNDEIVSTGIVKTANIKTKNKKSNAVKFGRAKSNKIVNSNNINKKGEGGKKLSQIQSNTVDKTKVRPENFKKTYYNAIHDGLDIAQGLVPIVNTNSSDPNVNKYCDNKTLEYISVVDNFTSDVILNTARSNFESIPQKPIEILRNSKPQSRNLVAVYEKSSNFIRTHSFKYTLRSDQVGTLNSFIVAIKVREPKTNLVVQILNLTIDHKIMVENFYIPDFLPQVSIDHTRLSNKGLRSVVMCVSNVDKKVGGISQSTRKIIDDSSLSLSYFSPQQDLDTFNEIMYQPGYKQHIGGLRESELFIVRISPITARGLRLCNFTSATLAGEEFNYTSANIIAKSTTSGVNLSLFGFSPNIEGVVPHRKSSADREFTPLGFAPSRMNEVTPIYSSIVGNSSLCFKPTFVDTTDPVEVIGKYNIITYAMRLFKKNGGDEFFKKLFTIEYIKPLNYVSVSCGDVSIEKIASFDSITLDRGVSYASVSFPVSFSMNVSATDQVKLLLDEMGYGDLFSEEMETLKGNISDLVFFGVERINMATSEKCFLGYHSAGTFTDNGLEGNSPPALGISYLYLPTVYLVTPGIMKSSYEKSISTNLNVLKTRDDILIPSKIGQLKVAVVNNTDNLVTSDVGIDVMKASTISLLESQFSSNKLDKNFSKVALHDGKLANMASNDEPQDFDLGKYCTGDYATVSVNLNFKNFNIISSTQTLTRSSSGLPVLRFTIVPDKLSSLSYIDFVVITCERNGQGSICGCGHPVDGGKFIFVDYLNRDYIGGVTYYATPVMINGDLGETSVIFTGVIKEPYKKIKKVG